jgi:hypothetical protein
MKRIDQEENQTNPTETAPAPIPSVAPAAPLFGFIDVPEQFYAINHGRDLHRGISRLTAPATYAQWSQVIAVLAAIAVFLLLLFNNINTPHTSISATLLDGWTCTQITPLSRSSAEVTETDFCGYTNNAASSNIIIAPYAVFKGRTEVDPYYTTTLNCPSGLQTPTANQKVYAFRDSYFWSGQQYDSYDQCMNTLTTMCNAHTTTTFPTSSTMTAADAAATTTPTGLTSGNIIGNVPANAYNGWYNRNWFMFNGSSCATPCGTSSPTQFTYPSPVVGVKIAKVASKRYWQGIAMSSDGTKIAATVNGNAQNGPIFVSTDSGVTWTSRASSQAWNGIAVSRNGATMAAVVNVGPIYVSTDAGVTWTARESWRMWSGIAMSSDGTKMAAVVSNGNGPIYVSTDSGTNWVPVANLSSRGIAISSDGTKMAVWGNQIYVSTDSGLNWTQRASSLYWQKIVMSDDGTKMISLGGTGLTVQIYVSTDSGVTWTPKESLRSWYSIAISSDGNKMASSLTGGQIYVSSDSGTTWNAMIGAVSQGGIGHLSMSSDGNMIAMAVSNADFIYIVSTSTIPAQTYSLPSMAYDGTISIGTSDVSPACPLITTTISMPPAQFCTIPSATVSALPINPAWQKAVSSVSKSESTGKWQFGSWGFCLDSPKYATCDAQFKGEVCNSGFFKAMLGDTICGKYKANKPYYCTKQPDYFSAISLAATTALSALGVVVTVLAVLLGQCFGKDYDGTTASASASSHTKQGLNAISSSSSSSSSSGRTTDEDTIELAVQGPSSGRTSTSSLHINQQSSSSPSSPSSLSQDAAVKSTTKVDVQKKKTMRSSVSAATSSSGPAAHVVEMDD